MLGAPNIIAGAPIILSEWAKMPFTQVDPYESYGFHTNQVDPDGL